MKTKENSFFESPVNVGLVLFAATMILFFVAYYFFADVDYYLTTVKMNAFVMPFLYAGGAMLSVFAYRKKHLISFPEVFRRAFVPMFIGGLLSLISIYIFFNHVDTDARDMLSRQGIQTYVESARTEYEGAKKLNREGGKTGSEEDRELDERYKAITEGMATDEVQNFNYFSPRYVMGFFALLCLFYLTLSLVFAAFFKTKKRFE